MIGWILYYVLPTFSDIVVYFVVKAAVNRLT